MLEQGIREEFGERIAIMMVDGECDEATAVLHAYRVLRDRYGREAIPQDIANQWGEAVKKSRLVQKPLFDPGEG